MGRHVFSILRHVWSIFQSNVTWCDSGQMVVESYPQSLSTKGWFQAFHLLRIRHSTFAHLPLSLLSLIFPGTTAIPRRNEKPRLCKTLRGKRGVLREMWKWWIPLLRLVKLTSVAILSVFALKILLNILNLISMWPVYLRIIFIADKSILIFE